MIGVEQDTMVTMWMHDGKGGRLVMSNTPRGRCYCEQCAEPLDYDYGSIRWQCREKDLCPSCWGKDAAERAFKEIRPRLDAIKGARRRS